MIAGYEPHSLHGFIGVPCGRVHGRAIGAAGARCAGAGAGCGAPISTIIRVERLGDGLTLAWTLGTGGRAPGLSLQLKMWR